MTGGDDGYVSDVAYSAKAFPDLAPVNLRLAALVAGVDGAPLRPGSVVWELGCGYGNSLIAAAVAHPACRFVGVDYNPAHIAGGHERIETLGLRNIELLDADLVDLADRPGSLPSCDVAVLHGLYSWVGEPIRAAVRRLLAWGVRPGGLVYVSYNSMPGAGAMAVAQRTVLELSRLSVGRSDLRIKEAADHLDRLKTAGAHHLNATDDIARQVERLKRGAGHELVHEYLNEGWAALFHSQVAADLEDARLTYVGSAVPHENFRASLLTPAQMKMIEDVPLSSVRETIVDLFVRRILRRDLFVRGPRPLGEAQRDRLLWDTWFCSRVHPDAVTLTLSWPAGSVTLPDAYGEAARVLWREGPRPLGALLAGPLAPVKPVPREAAALLVASGIAWPCRPDRAPETLAAMKRAVLELGAEVRAIGLHHNGMIPAPAVGTDVPVGGLEARVLEGLWSGVQAEASALAAHVWAPMEAAGESLVHKGERIQEPGRCRALLTEIMTGLQDTRFPLWRGLGMLPPSGPTMATQGDGA
ncbi:class I SAM-dependent methyltransferase [Roseospira navarrensis]|uniref:Methyltransferase domain-containing protein n=1 Tax=Roseospira navarrensis TaxID=140058 RepID=A0A7X2D252_9PROT|nr:methyltransferase regulatory domain-containing protein [Roseospira navarrensis]MQX35934.1 methyltransferase domain-containing protein [Roseospira navarrensis]